MAEAFTTALSTVWDQISNCIDTIKEEAILMLPIGVSFAGAIIGLAKGFLRFGGRRRR